MKKRYTREFKEGDLPVSLFLQRGCRIRGEYEDQKSVEPWQGGGDDGVDFVPLCLKALFLSV